MCAEFFLPLLIFPTLSAFLLIAVAQQGTFVPLAVTQAKGRETSRASGVCCMTFTTSETLLWTHSKGILNYYKRRNLAA